MLTRDWPGACEGDLRTDGIAVVNLYGSPGIEILDIRTGAIRRIVDPPQVLRWPRVTPAGPVKLCGQGQSSDSFQWADGFPQTWDWTGPAHGESPVIYDGRNDLHIIRPAADQTSQGYRCLDGRGAPVLGDATIAIATVPDGRLLHKYTPIETPAGLLLIGQDHESGCHVVYQNVRYVLDTGNVQFIRAAWTAADGLAVLVTHYDLQIVRTFLLTLAEIPGLPVFGSTPVPPIDPPPIVAPPKFTITSPTFPVTGPAPLEVRCVYANEPGGGPLDWIDWLMGSSPAGPWTVAASNPGSDPDHTYRFQAAGEAYIKARGGNKAGTHETGATRHVTATGPVDPIPPIPPDPPAADRWRLATVHGGYLAVGPDKFLLEAPAGDLFEMIQVGVTIAETPIVGLKVQGAYVAAEPDGGLKADRGSVGAWEYFRKDPDTTVETAINLWSVARGAYISAHDDGTVRADQPVAGGWERFTPIAGPPPVEYSRWYVSGHLFRNLKGEAVRLMGFTGFKILRMLADLVDCSAVLEYFQARRANCVRVWAYLPPGHPIDGGWEPPSTLQLLNGIGRLRSYGFTTYLTLLTDDDPARIPWAQQTVRELGAAGLDSLILEIGNEPQINKQIDTQALRAVCDASGLLYTSGEYADSALWFGSFGDAHTPRDLEWPRKAHDLHEYQVGGGPSYPQEPACPVPWIAGEPIKPTEAPNAPQTDDRGVTIYRAEDFLAYGATCGLLGAGAIFHYEGGKTGQLPSGDEIACCDDFFEGLQAFPAEMLGPGSYVRIDEHGETLRTYAKGPYRVRIRPKSGPILITG